MQGISQPFTIRYDGGDAKYHVLDAVQLSESMAGAARIYNSTIYYLINGSVPKGNYKKEFTCYASTPAAGCYEIPFLAAAYASQNLIFAELGKEAFTHVLSMIVGALKKLWTSDNSGQIVKELTTALTETAKNDENVHALLVNGIVKANDNLASLQSQLIETLPALAAANHSSAIKMVAPIGRSCDSLSQFHGTSFATNIGVPEAETIRSGENLDVGEPGEFECLKITEINRNTGHCEMMVQGFEAPIKGKITDPNLEQPGNIYTKALDQQTPFSFTGKPVTKDGEVWKFYISDANK